VIVRGVRAAHLHEGHLLVVDGVIIDGLALFLRVQPKVVHESHRVLLVVLVLSLVILLLLALLLLNIIGGDGLLRHPLRKGLRIGLLALFYVGFGLLVLGLFVRLGLVGLVRQDDVVNRIVLAARKARLIKTLHGLRLGRGQLRALLAVLHLGAGLVLGVIVRGVRAAHLHEGHLLVVDGVIIDGLALFLRVQPKVVHESHRVLLVVLVLSLVILLLLALLLLNIIGGDGLLRHPLRKGLRIGLLALLNVGFGLLVLGLLVRLGLVGIVRQGEVVNRIVLAARQALKECGRLIVVLVSNRRVGGVLVQRVRAVAAAYVSVRVRLLPLVAGGLIVLLALADQRHGILRHVHLVLLGHSPDAAGQASSQSCALVALHGRQAQQEQGERQHGSGALHCCDGVCVGGCLPTQAGGEGRPLIA